MSDDPLKQTPLSELDRDNRLNRLGPEHGWFYISFALPKSQGGFLGATVVQAQNAPAALEWATRRGLNPGGEAQIIPIPPERAHHPEVVPLRNRLVSKEEIMARGKVGHGYHQNAEVVCADCNK
jgi:hypothetical protein